MASRNVRLTECCDRPRAFSNRLSIRTAYRLTLHMSFIFVSSIVPPSTYVVHCLVLFVDVTAGNFDGLKPE